MLKLSFPTYTLEELKTAVSDRESLITTIKNTKGFYHNIDDIPRSDIDQDIVEGNIWDMLSILNVKEVF